MAKGQENRRGKGKRKNEEESEARIIQIRRMHKSTLQAKEGSVTQKMLVQIMRDRAAGKKHEHATKEKRRGAQGEGYVKKQEPKGKGKVKKTRRTGRTSTTG